VQIMAFVLTVFRVWFRLHIRRFWWEDAFAAIAGVCSVAKLIASWILILVQSKGTTFSVSFWITTITFPCITWSARMSILLSITRLARPTQWIFRLSLGFAIIFSMMWAGSIVQRALECGSDDKWHPVKNPSAPFCNIYGSIAVYELATSCAADVMLVVFSFRLLWNVNLPPRQRRMILIIFSSSIVMSLFSLFHAVTNFSLVTGITTVAVNLETSCSVIVCNLLVIVTYAYRVLNRKPDDDQEDDDFTRPISTVSTSQQLTTIDHSATSRQLTTIVLDTFAGTSPSDTRA